MLKAAALLLVLAQVGGTPKWLSKPASSSTMPDKEVRGWWRYIGQDEGDSIGLIYRIERSLPANDSVVVRLKFQDDPSDRSLATPGMDFEIPPATVILPAGQRWVDVRIPFLNDDIPESPTEHLVLSFEVVGVVPAPVPVASPTTSRATQASPATRPATNPTQRNASGRNGE